MWYYNLQLWASHCRILSHTSQCLKLRQMLMRNRSSEYISFSFGILYRITFIALGYLHKCSSLHASRKTLIISALFTNNIALARILMCGGLYRILTGYTYFSILLVVLLILKFCLGSSLLALLFFISTWCKIFNIHTGPRKFFGPFSK